MWNSLIVAHFRRLGVTVLRGKLIGVARLVSKATVPSYNAFNTSVHSCSILLFS